MSRRNNWSRHIDQVLRSRHYTWLAEGLAGAPLEQALTEITADMMHMCERSGISWESVLEQSHELFSQEESRTVRDGQTALN